VQAESFGVVLLEAMAAGAAVVASDLAGYRWVAEDAALYFTAGDVKELRDALARALADGELRSNLASRGRVVARKYDWKNLLADVLAAYEDAIRLAKQRKWRSDKKWRGNKTS
jgi:phosphatidylinositol alpha-mannosyltransferase